MAAAATDETAMPNGRQSPWQRAVEVLLIVAVFFIATGDLPPNVNESHYLCRLKHFWDPAWCTGDLFLNSTDTQVVFIWLLGWITRFVSLTATAWIGRVVAWTLLAWTWQRLSWRIIPRPLAAVLSAALFVALNAYGNMAGEWIVGGVEAKCFAYAFVLLALRNLLDRRWNFVWVHLGIATAFHPIVGGWSGIVCVGIWLIDARGWHELRQMLPGFALGGSVALLGIVPALTLTWGVPAETVAESSRTYVFDRLPHHLAPLTLPQPEATRRLVGHAILLTVLYIVSRALGATGSARVSRSHNRAPAKPMAPRREAASYILQFACGAVLLAVVGFAIELVLYNQPLLAAKLLRYYWFRLTDFAAAMAVALYITALVTAGFEKRRAWATPLLLVAICFAGWFLGSTSWARLQNPIPPADNKIVDYSAWVEVCDWVAANTPPNALFITPRLNCSFKWRTGRPEVANRKDIPQDAAGIVEWSKRLKDLFATQLGGEEFSVDSVGALGTERVKELANKYHAQYVLSDRAQLLKLPIAFWNREYVVYRIENRKPDNGR